MKTIISYGGGVDSFRMLLFAIERGIKVDAAVFENVADSQGKDPGEWASTYRHIREVAEPLCRRHGIPFVWLDERNYPVRGARSLFAWLQGDRGEGKPRANPQIPVCGPTRICTTVAKVERFEKWLNDTHPNQDVEVWVGFEAGEEKRAQKDPNAGKGRKPRPGAARRHNRFPLMEAGLCRCRCEADIRTAGYPVPRKSACVFCPYGTRGDWQTFARELPEQFEQVVALEAAKPPTKKSGVKLPIMGYRVVKDAQGNVLRRVTPMLKTYIARQYRPKKMVCKVCGNERASKATGCTYLDDNRAAA